MFSIKSPLESLTEIEKQTLENAISQTQGNIQKAAKALGISRTTFYNKAKKYGITI